MDGKSGVSLSRLERFPRLVIQGLTTACRRFATCPLTEGLDERRILILRRVADGRAVRRASSRWNGVTADKSTRNGRRDFRDGHRMVLASALGQHGDLKAPLCLPVRLEKEDDHDTSGRLQADVTLGCL